MLNAVSHRDYRRSGSVFVRQYPYRLTVVSPGGFPTGITLENNLTRQEPVNRRIAQALQRCGLIERAGQGMDLIFTTLIRESKPQPDFTDTDDYQVSITFHGEVQNPSFVRFLEKVGQERLRSFSTQDFLVLDAISRERKLTGELLGRAALLREEGIVEKIGRRYILSRDYYDFVGQRGVYTRKRGLDSETNRQLLLKHIADNAVNGSPLRELQQVLPHLSGDSVQRLVRDLKQEGKIYKKGRTRGARWYPSP
jgi:ATP-dependent DNA helicase RecG